MLFWWNHPKKEFCCSNNFGKNYIKSLPHENLSYLLAHLYYLIIYMCICGFPSGASSKESACKCRRPWRHTFSPWFGMIPWSRKWQHNPVFSPEKFHGQRSLAGSHRVGQDWVTEHAHIYVCVCIFIVYMNLFYIVWPKFSRVIWLPRPFL